MFHKERERRYIGDTARLCKVQSTILRASLGPCFLLLVILSTALVCKQLLYRQVQQPTDSDWPASLPGNMKSYPLLYYFCNHLSQFLYYSLIKCLTDFTATQIDIILFFIISSILYSTSPSYFKIPQDFSTFTQYPEILPQLAVTFFKTSLSNFVQFKAIIIFNVLILCRKLT